jgi:hypothetical protein
MAILKTIPRGPVDVLKRQIYKLNGIGTVHERNMLRTVVKCHSAAVKMTVFCIKPKCRSWPERIISSGLETWQNCGHLLPKFTVVWAPLISEYGFSIQLFFSGVYIKTQLFILFSRITSHIKRSDIIVGLLNPLLKNIHDVDVLKWLVEIRVKSFTSLLYKTWTKYSQLNTFFFDLQ